MIYLNPRRVVTSFCLLLTSLWVFFSPSPVFAVSSADLSSLERAESKPQIYKSTKTDSRWEWSSTRTRKSPEAVVLIIHGLNTNPQKMKSLAREFQKNAETVNVTLTGHGGSLEAFKSVTRSQWLDDLYQAYRFARQRADQLKVPLYVNGYSLGGVLAVDLATHPQYRDVTYDKMFLIAPAIALNPRSRLVKLFNIFGDRYILKSLNARAYRANVSGTSMAAYNALFDSVEAIHNRSASRLRNTPAVIVMDPRDELVSDRGIEQWMRSVGVQHWQLHFVNNNQSTLERAYRHLMIDEASMGSRPWEELKAVFSRFAADGHR